MARLNLNKSDKEDLMRDVRAYVRTKYDESSLGTERKALIDKVADLSREIRRELFPNEDVLALQRHGCLHKSDPDLTKHTLKMILVKDSGSAFGEIDLTISWHRGHFMDFTIPIVLPARGGQDSTHMRILRCIEHAVNLPELSGALWTISDKMSCESQKIIDQYEAVLEASRTYEAALERCPEIERMVEPATVAEIRKSKEPSPLEIDPQVVLFGKEVVSEKQAKKKAKKKEA